MTATRYICLIGLAALAVLILATLASAATTRPSAPPDAIISRVKDDLQSPDPARIATALADIKAAAAMRGRGFAGPTALNVLFDLNRYDDVDQIALAQILANPSDALYTGNFAKARARALMFEGKKDEALAAAKGYYNVCPMASTQDAINLISMILNSARPDEPGVGSRFLRQQIAWASSDPTTQPADARASSRLNVEATTQPSDESLGDAILPTIKIDPAPYKLAIDAIFPEKSNDALSKGNLLLLADRNAEAHSVFELALGTARGSAVTWLIESVARSIRAEKGCVAPANAFVESMQGK